MRWCLERDSDWLGDPGHPVGRRGGGGEKGREGRERGGERREGGRDDCYCSQLRQL